MPHFSTHARSPPSESSLSDPPLSALSTTTAFHDALDQRDKFLGIGRCVVCGDHGHEIIEHCHVVRDSEPDTWEDLKKRGWIPKNVKRMPGHDPRNGMLMCSTHHRQFDQFAFVIRFIPETRKFVFINYTGHTYLQQFHGKAIALDIKDEYAPFASLFMIHEMRVRGFHPFQPSPAVPRLVIPWQDWILSDNVLDNTSGSFKRDGPPRDYSKDLSAHATTTSADGASSSSQRGVLLDEGVIGDILAATRAMPSWKACQVEGTGWTGTAEENIQKYVGLQDR